MALTHSTNARNAMLDSLDDQVNAGTTDASGDFVVLDAPGTTVLVSFTLDNPAFNAASGGTMALAGVPKSTPAAATGTAAKFEIRDRNNAVVQSGTITATGGGGDVTADNTSIASGQTINLSSYTLTAPA